MGKKWKWRRGGLDDTPRIHSLNKEKIRKSLSSSQEELSSLRNQDGTPCQFEPDPLPEPEEPDWKLLW